MKAHRIGSASRKGMTLIPIKHESEKFHSFEDFEDYDHWLEQLNKSGK